MFYHLVHFCHRQHAHAKRLKCCKKDFKIFVFLILTRLCQNLVSLHVEKMFANIRKFRNKFTGFIDARNKQIFRLFHKYLRSHVSPEKFFQGGQRCHFSYPFHVADDAMQIDVHKTLNPFSPQMKWSTLPHESKKYILLAAKPPWA